MQALTHSLIHIHMHIHICIHTQFIGVWVNILWLAGRCSDFYCATVGHDDDDNDDDDDDEDDDHYQVDDGVANYVYDYVYELQFNKFSLAQWAGLSPGRCLIKGVPLKQLTRAGVRHTHMWN